jgi:hypothetical protein
VVDNEDLTPEEMKRRSQLTMTCLQAKMKNDKIEIRQETIKEEANGNKEFCGRVEG